MHKNGIERFYSLDVLRGLAAISIVMFHFPVFFGQDNYGEMMTNSPLFIPLLMIYTKGYLAVDMFFCLSGFVFCHIYADHIKSGRVTWRLFLWLRLSRLYPLHFATLIMVALAQASFYADNGHYFSIQHNDKISFLLNLVFASAWFDSDAFSSFNLPAWSISVEVFLYLIFYLCCRLLSLRVKTFLVIAAVGFVIHYDWSIGRGLFAFFIGCSTLMLYQKISRSDRAHSFGKWIVFLAVYTWVATWAASYPWIDINSEFAVLWPVVFLFPLTILALALIENRFEFRRFAIIGDISYSVYLLHFPLQLMFYWAASHFALGNAIFYSPMSMLAFFAVLLPLSWLSYRCLEMPAQRYLRRACRLMNPPTHQSVRIYADQSTTN